MMKNYQYHHPSSFGSRTTAKYDAVSFLLLVNAMLLSQRPLLPACTAAHPTHFFSHVPLKKRYTCQDSCPPNSFRYKYRGSRQIHNRAVTSGEEEAKLAEMANASASASATATATAAAAAAAAIADATSADKLRQEFFQVLCSRRSPGVPLTVEPGKPVKDPLYQGDEPPPTHSEAMESCPRRKIDKDELKEENFYVITEEGQQGRLPVLVLSLKEGDEKKRRPAVVFLHSTNKCKEWLRPLLEAYASRGYVAIAVDSRYHGERATNKSTYIDALVSAWKTGETMPFIFDTVWDLIKLADYLTQREDIDPKRIGITGESLGGMHAWFAAFADTRYAMVVPIIGVQGFRWAIDNDEWQARVNSIKPMFEEARIDLGKSEIDKEVVEKVWNRIAPGLASCFDSPYSVPAIAPRPLLILNGAQDSRCPLPGLEVPKLRASKAYEGNHSHDKFKLIAEPGIGHRMTISMVKEASDWFDKFLGK